MRGAFVVAIAISILILACLPAAGQEGGTVPPISATWSADPLEGVPEIASMRIEAGCWVNNSAYGNRYRVLNDGTAPLEGVKIVMLYDGEEEKREPEYVDITIGAHHDIDVGRDDGVEIWVYYPYAIDKPPHYIRKEPADKGCSPRLYIPFVGRQ